MPEKRAQRPKDAQHCGRCPDKGKVLSYQQRKQTSKNARAEVDQPETPGTIELLDPAPNDIQPEHIEEQVYEAKVEEEGCANPPNLALKNKKTQARQQQIEVKRKKSQHQHNQIERNHAERCQRQAARGEAIANHLPPHWRRRLPCWLALRCWRCLNVGNLRDRADLWEEGAEVGVATHARCLRFCQRGIIASA